MHASYYQDSDTMSAPGTTIARIAEGSSIRDEQETIEYLEKLTWSIMEARNRRDYEYLRSADFLGPSWTASLDYNVKEPPRLEEHIAEYEKMVEEYPEHRLRLLDASTSLDLEHRYASVYLNMELTGHPPGVVQTGIGVFDWRLVRQKWVCSKMMGMRGGSYGK